MPLKEIGSTKAIELSYGTGSPNQRKVFFARGLWWFFFSDGERIMFSTSVDGNKWGHPTFSGINGGHVAEAFSVWCDSNRTNVYVVKQGHEERAFSCFVGDLRDDRSINWSSKLAADTKNKGQYPGTFVCARDPEDVWVATTTMDSLMHRYTEVWRFDGRDWVNARALDFGPNTAIRPAIVLPASKGVVLIYGRTHHDDQIYFTSTENGLIWSPDVSPPNHYRLGGAALIGNAVYYCAPSDGDLRFFLFEPSSRSIKNEVIVDTGSVEQATLSSDGASILVAAYAGLGEKNSVFCKVSTDAGATWGPRMTVAEGIPLRGFSLTGSYDVAQGACLLGWTEGRANQRGTVKIFNLEVSGGGQVGRVQQ